jgi:hypothetical protein
MYPKIKPFDIDKTGFGAMSAWITIDNIARIKRLQTLNLKNCELIDDDSLLILSSLKKLKHIVLYGCKLITIAGIYHISTLDLEHIDLSYCVLIGNDSMNHISLFKSLKILLLTGCTQIDDEGINNIKELNLLQIIDVRNCILIDDECLKILSNLRSLEILHN